MGKVTGRAAILHRFVNIDPGKGLFLVAFETKSFRGRIKKLRVLGVVRCMAGFALAGIYRLMYRCLAGSILKLVVARQANVRYRLPHLNGWNLTVREMTTFTVRLLNRLVNNTGRKSGHLFRMALGTSHPFLWLALLRGRPTTRDKKQNPHANETECP